MAVLSPLLQDYTTEHTKQRFEAKATTRNLHLPDNP